jgi:hypothetical protein
MQKSLKVRTTKILTTVTAQYYVTFCPLLTSAKLRHTRDFPARVQLQQLEELELIDNSHSSSTFNVQLPLYSNCSLLSSSWPMVLFLFKTKLGWMKRRISSDSALGSWNHLLGKHYSTTSLVLSFVWMKSLASEFRSNCFGARLRLSRARIG